MSQIVSPDNAGEYLLTPEELAETRRLLLGLEKGIFALELKDEEDVIQLVKRAFGESKPSLDKIVAIVKSKEESQRGLLDAWVNLEQRKLFDKLYTRFAIRAFYETNLPTDLAISGYGPVGKPEATVIGKSDNWLITHEIKIPRMQIVRTKGPGATVAAGVGFERLPDRKFPGYFDLTTEILGNSDKGKSTLTTRLRGGLSQGGGSTRIERAAGMLSEKKYLEQVGIYFATLLATSGGK